MAGYIGSKASVTQVDGYNRSEADAEFVQVTGDTMTGALAVDGNLTVDTNTLFVDAANNRVGVGTSSPQATLQVLNQLKVSSADQSSGAVVLGDGSSTAFNVGIARWNGSTNAAGAGGVGYFAQGSGNAGGHFFYTGDAAAGSTTERARIDASGNLLVGKTTTAFGTQGIRLEGSNGKIELTRNNNVAFAINRLTSDGDLAQFYKDGTIVGSIGTAASYVYVANTSRGLHFGHSGSDSQIVPCDGSGANLDNVIDLGASAIRFDDIFATNGTIQTSDRNEKQDIAALDEAERRVAVACKGLMRKFRWKSAVEEKGDDARIHFGIIAQDLQDAFAAEGLDAGRYAMFISSTWWEADEVIPAVEEVLDEEGNVVTEAQPERTVTNTYETAEEAPEGATERTRMGVRYSELLAFIIGAL